MHDARAGALVDSDDGSDEEWDEDAAVEPMLAGLGTLRCATGSLCVSASVTEGVSAWECCVLLIE